MALFSLSRKAKLGNSCGHGVVNFVTAKDPTRQFE
jgi:hypothetical protein